MRKAVDSGWWMVEMQKKQQVPPLRCAPVVMTNQR
jgi:hypothetical protein